MKAIAGWLALIIAVNVVSYAINKDTGLIETESDTSAVEVIDKAEENKPEETKYKTSGEWAALDSGYVFAVEVEDFDGDVYEAGTYRFELVGGKFEEGKTQPAMYSIYISDNFSADMSELTVDNAKGVMYVGGMMDTARGVELKAGQYVYVVPERSALPASGWLVFEAMK